ncbi:hypothetical protein [Bifidobacterium cuniculi]|uniref:ABC-type xylose transport system protein n=1 Tax=Bifidobacterium cuniculi TaxID=1688 RepID=A0A087AVX0_9BIFI|nr:hypothetical protein [Bifidobacterium cuniculi]KFI62920.1 ABC-type xylose transport system protein [Bifidobacterium cuniculi]
MVTSTLPRRVLAALTGVLIIMATCGCGQAKQHSPAAADTGDVAIFTPDDGFTLARDVPLNTWHRLVDALREELDGQGIDGDHVEVHTDSDLDSQNEALQDYVSDRTGDVRGSAEGRSGATTLVLAPAVAHHDLSRYYGDYVTAATSQEDAEALDRMADTLTLAREAGMRVVLLGNAVEGFTPDVQVPLVSARQIGQMQAEQLVSKLRLDSVSRGNPKYVEILVPYVGEEEQSLQFAQEAFAGVWSVLAGYFRSGKVISPSLRVTAATGEDDWEQVAFPADSAADVDAELRQRLGTPASHTTHVRIDGIISMDDSVAKDVCDTLSDLKYTGSAADINPSISIGDVVGSITGRQDVHKQQVPDPTRAPAVPDESSRDGSSSQWPIVTGFGAYISNMPDIVNGKQWMTGLVDMDANAHAVADVCVRLNAGTSLEVEYLEQADNTAQGAVHVPLTAVSAGNLKETLIDPGYVTLADAGL